MNAVPRWSWPVGIVVMTALAAVLGWTLFARSRRMGLAAEGSPTAELVGSEAEACQVGVVPSSSAVPSAENGLGLREDIPALDRKQPDEFETATFAMG